MRKKHILSVIAFIALAIAGCKKEASKSNQNTQTDNSKLIVGKWERTSNVDTVIYQNGQKDISGGITYNDYTYVFNSDGTGTFYQFTTKAFDIKYALSGQQINVTVTQAYKQDGTPASVHIIPYTIKFVKLTDNQLMVRSDTTTVNVNGVSMHAIMVDTYTKYPQ